MVAWRLEKLLKPDFLFQYVSFAVRCGGIDATTSTAMAAPSSWWVRLRA
jgi:hypothetical protein